MGVKRGREASREKLGTGRGPAGAPVHKVLVEQTMDIEREIYLSITTDGGRKRPVVIASAEGGMEIEEVAQNEQ